MAVVLVDLIGRQMQRCEGYFLGVELLWLEYAEALYDSLCARKRSVDALTIRVRICKRERSRLARHLIVPSAFLASSMSSIISISRTRVGRLHLVLVPNGPEIVCIVMRIATSNPQNLPPAFIYFLLCYLFISRYQPIKSKPRHHGIPFND